MIWQTKDIDEDEADPQLVFPFEAMNQIYSSHMLIETLYNLVDVLSRAEGTYYHRLQVKARYDYSKRELENLEKRLRQVGWVYDFEKQEFRPVKGKKPQDLYSCNV